MLGKNMNYYLMDGIPNGRIKCTLANWTGVVYKIPRVRLVDCKNIDVLKQSGVYFLFGRCENDKPLVYVGQAGTRKNGEGVLNRLKEHHSSPQEGMDDWHESVVFTTSNNIFGATEISWLENRFFGLAQTANRYRATNSNEPNAGNITEEKESELEEYVNYAKIVMGTLGHFVFEPLVQPLETPKSFFVENDTALEFYLEQKIRNSGLTVKGVCRRSSEGYIVLKGSVVNPKINIETCSGIAVSARKNSKFDDNILLEDVLFTSPSAAAGFITGASANGYVVWKTTDGKTLKEVETSEADELEPILTLTNT
jgi:hypothetical protein